MCGCTCGSQGGYQESFFIALPSYSLKQSVCSLKPELADLSSLNNNQLAVGNLRLRFPRLDFRAFAKPTTPVFTWVL